MNRSLSLCALVCLALLAACEKKATGQVAAVVNGEEITLQEINTELEALSPSQQDAKDKKKLQQAALQRIVERRLLAQAARDDGLDEGATLVMQTEGKNGWFWYIPLHDDIVSVGVVADFDASTSPVATSSTS